MGVITVMGKDQTPCPLLYCCNSTKPIGHLQYKKSTASVPTKDSAGLTFEQQQEVDRLAKLAFTPSSNSNKYRYELYAFIEAHTAAQVAATVEIVRTEYKDAERRDKEMTTRNRVKFARDNETLGESYARNQGFKSACLVIEIKIKDHLTTGQNTDKYKCPSYYDGNNKLQGCTCGACK